VARLWETAEGVEALLLEHRVAHGQHLVEEEDVGIHLDRGGERETDLHARGVVVELHVDEVLELREADHVAGAPPRLTGTQPDEGRRDGHVVRRAEAGMEADSQLDEGREPAAYLDVARVGPVDARDAAQ
jgi:hypothetical protein